jgi:hypothetical protein
MLLSMTLSKLQREENNKVALTLMFGLLEDDAINIALFQSTEPPFASQHGKIWCVTDTSLSPSHPFTVLPPRGGSTV